MVLSKQFHLETTDDISWILSSVVRTFFKENYGKILPVHSTWKVPEKGFMINLEMH